MTCATIGIVGKIGKRQGMFVELNLPHINDGISAIITINSFWIPIDASINPIDGVIWDTPTPPLVSKNFEVEQSYLYYGNCTQ